MGTIENTCICIKRWRTGVVYRLCVVTIGNICVKGWRTGNVYRLYVVISPSSVVTIEIICEVLRTGDVHRLCDHY